VQAALVSAAIFLVSAAIPASAQSLGVGASFLGDEGGTGVIVDYSKPFQSSMTTKKLGWVGDFSYFHKGFGNDVFGGGSANTLLLQGGVRISGEAGEKLEWLGQGLIGLRHASFSYDDNLGGICDLGDCSDSDNGGVLTLGGGLQYALNEKLGVRGQLDFPIALGDGGSTTRFSIMLVLKRGK
jgi:hypothetical protein